MNDAPDTVRSHDGHDRLLALMGEFTDKLRVACDSYRTAKRVVILFTGISAISLCLCILMVIGVNPLQRTGGLPGDWMPKSLVSFTTLVVSVTFTLIRYWQLEALRERIPPLYFAVDKLTARAAQLEDHAPDLDLDSRLQLTVRLAEADVTLTRARRTLPSLMTTG